MGEKACRWGRGVPPGRTEGGREAGDQVACAQTITKMGSEVLQDAVAVPGLAARSLCSCQGTPGPLGHPGLAGNG